MPTSEKDNQLTSGNAAQNNEASFRKSIRKAPGTRVGTIQDWRAAGSAKSLGRHGASIRDGR